MTTLNPVQLTPGPSSEAKLNAYSADPINLAGRETINGYHDRQDQEALKVYDDKPRGRKTWKDKARRILVGKEEDEELYEKRHSKKLNWFKREGRKHFAEFFGTFFLILFICGIQVNQGMYPNGGVNNIDKGIVSGFVLVGLIFSFGRVSGAHFNPCVTLAFLLRGAFNFWRFCTYVLVQFAGAVSAAAVLWALYGNYDHLGATVPGPPVTNTEAFGTEILITFLLITVILSTAEDASVEDATAGLAVGLTFGAIEVLAWNFSGASVNPWRSIAPIMISDFGWKTYWIYIIGPIVGTICAVIVERLMMTGLKHEEEEGGDRVQGKKDTEAEKFPHSNK